MNNTANPTRTEVAPGRDSVPWRRVEALAGTVLATVILTMVIVSFRPFQPAGAEVETGGDMLNQLGYGALGALALAGLFTLADRRLVAALISPWWLILMGFLALSVFTAPSPPDAARAALFTVIGILAMTAVLILPRDAERFSAVLAVTFLFVLGLNYFGVAAMPVAIHSAAGLDTQHAGLWRGSFAHKNTAAPVMACISFGGIYLWRRGWRLAGAVIFVLAMIFMANAGSKTTLGTAPLAILLVALPSMFGLRFLAPMLVLAVLVGSGLATLGIVFIEPLAALQKELFPDLTYTGRTTLWAFMGEKLAERPWTGYGFESFWGGDMVLRSNHPFDRAWDVRAIVHGHNGYLDLAVTMGLPALAAAVVAFVFAPLRDFLRTPPLKENILLADFFLMIAAFALASAFLESFFFRRAGPLWLLMVFALLGLRLSARFAVPTRRAE